MAAPKRTKAQREQDLTRLAALCLRGLTQAEMAARLNVCRQQVQYDLKELHRRWVAAQLADTEARKALELAKIDHVERTYWRAWRRSRKARQARTRAKATAGAGAAKLRASLRREGRDGNPAFLAGVLRCIQRRAAILGLDAPRTVAPTTPAGKEPYAGLTDEQLADRILAFLGPAPGPGGSATVPAGAPGASGGRPGR